MFSELDNWFVGTGREFESAVMTEASLLENMEAVFTIAGDKGAATHWREPGTLAEMHAIRNRMFGLDNPELRNSYCGKLRNVRIKTIQLTSDSTYAGRPNQALQRGA